MFKRCNVFFFIIITVKIKWVYVLCSFLCWLCRTEHAFIKPSCGCLWNEAFVIQMAVVSNVDQAFIYFHPIILNATVRFDRKESDITWLWLWLEESNPIMYYLFWDFHCCSTNTHQIWFKINSNKKVYKLVYMRLYCVILLRI